MDRAAWLKVTVILGRATIILTLSYEGSVADDPPCDGEKNSDQAFSSSFSFLTRPRFRNWHLSAKHSVELKFGLSDLARLCSHWRAIRPRSAPPDCTVGLGFCEGDCETRPAADTEKSENKARKAVNDHISKQWYYE